MASDPKGDIWVLRNGMASALVNGKLVTQFTEGSSTPYVQSICSSKEGGVWVASQEIFGVKYRGGRAMGMARALGYDRPDCFAKYLAGMLVAGTQDRGLFIVRPGGAFLNLSRSNGLPTDWISSLCEDQEGNLWIGSGGNGLIMIRPGSVTALNPRISGRGVRSMFDSRCRWRAMDGVPKELVFTTGARVNGRISVQATA